MFPKRTAAVLLAGASALALSGCNGVVADDAASGETFHFTLSTAAQPGTPNAAVQDWFLDELEARSDGRIVIERTEPEAICPSAEVVECVRDGRAQIGVTVPDYTPQYFPTLSMVSIPFIGENLAAIMRTLYELHEEYEPAIEVLNGHGLHHVATWPVGRLVLGTAEPIERKEDLAGLSMRASGPIAQQILADQGVDIQALTAHETYEGVQRGLVSSAAGAIDFAVNYRLMELLPYWTDPGVGQYSTFGMWLSVDAYESLPDDLRAVVDEVAEELNDGVGIDEFNGAAGAQCGALLEAPTVTDFTAWSEEATSAWAEEVAESSRQQWIDLASSQGLDDPAALLEEYEAGLAEHADLEYTDATLECEAQFAAR